MKHFLPAAAAVVVLLAGCSSAAPQTSEPPSEPAETQAPEPTEESPAELTATEIATAIQGGVDTVTQVVTITEDNDPNDLIGRPTGYSDAAVIYDSALACQDLGVDCGATIEIWADEQAAQARADYIMGILEESPVFGTEYHFLHDNVLLRVAGDLVPSVAQQYEAEFNAAFE